MDLYIKQLEKLYGDVKIEPNGEYRINCPACSKRVGKADTDQHLYVNTKKFNSSLRLQGVFHCFRCEYKGWGLEKLGLTSKDAYSIKDLLAQKTFKESLLGTPLKFPDHFETDFSKYSSGKACLNYLTKVRKIPYEKIIEYKIGYCPEGKYKDCVVLPVFDNKDLVYYVARYIYNKRYLNPSVPNRAIVFNLKRQSTIIITEGIFDAINVGDNGVALLGKVLKKEQATLIKKAGPKLVYIMLDLDAKNFALNIAEVLKDYIPEIKLVSTGNKKDAGSMTQKEIGQALEAAYPYTLKGTLNYLYGTT